MAFKRDGKEFYAKSLRSLLMFGLNPLFNAGNFFFFFFSNSGNLDFRLIWFQG